MYGKLAPQAVNSTLLAEDGEANFTTKDKRNPSDFALWKAAKPGEPAWESPSCAGDPAGKGRPGQPALELSLHADIQQVLDLKLSVLSGQAQGDF